MLEERYNPYHDPRNGRFTTGNGGRGFAGTSLLYVEKGKTGGGILLKDLGFEDKDAAKAYYSKTAANSKLSEFQNVVNGANQVNTTKILSGNETVGKMASHGVAGTGVDYKRLVINGEETLVRSDYVKIDRQGNVTISDKSTLAPRPNNRITVKELNEGGHEYAPAEINGVAKGSPMSFSEADNGSVNPNFSKGTYGYTHNCQSCVVALEARFRGYDVEVTAKNSVGTCLSYNPEAAWINPATGKNPAQLAVTTAADIDKSIGQGERYSLHFGWKGRRYGHIISADKDEQGTLRLYDPQSNKTFSGTQSIDNYLLQTRNAKIFRVDNCDFNIKAVEGVTTKRR